MSHVLRMTPEQLAAIQSRNGARRVTLMPADYAPLPAGKRIPDAAERKVTRPRGKAKPSKLDLSEHAEQALLVSWWALWAPANGLDANLLFAIPNAAKRSYSLAAWMTAEGLRRGVPDLFLAKTSPRAHGLFIEMKSRTGKVNPDQAEYHGLLRASGYAVEVCHGCEQAIQAITRYLASTAAPKRDAGGHQEGRSAFGPAQAGMAVVGEP